MKRSKYILYIWAIGGILAFTGCNDFLDRSPQHPEDDRIADDRAAEDRGELPAPDDPECLFPVFHACFAVMPKKADTEVSAAANPSQKGLFNCFNYCLECFWLVHRQVGQNLAVQCDALGVEFADKL